MSISSLGAGSGVLTSTVIDQLKAGDTAAIITPIDNKITLQKQKTSALSLLDSLLSTFKSSASAIGESGLYQKRSVTGNTASVNVTADAGVNVQSFSISDTQMALKNVIESGSFTTATNSIATGSGTMTLKVGGLSYDVSYTSAMTLDSLKDSINSAAGSSIKASTLQVGTNDYRLILTSIGTGVDQNITLLDSTDGSLNNTLTSYKKIQSQAFTSSTDLVASDIGSLTLKMDSTSYNINYTTTTTLQDLTDAINTKVGSNIASIDSSNRLILKSNIAGFTSDLTLTDTNGNLDTKLSAYTTLNPIENIQSAKDASFKYNGITLTRSSNTIDDIVVGMKINLLQNSGSADITIAQDSQAISDEVSVFVQNYNSLTSQLTSMTTTDIAGGTIGIFNGDNSINAISREINQIVTSLSSSGYSLPQFGIDLSQTGTMSFNSTAFLDKFNKNPAASEAFFSGSTTTDSNGYSVTIGGMFTSMNTLLGRYTDSKGIIETLTTGSANDLKALTANKTKAQSLLDSRYTAMTARFVQYDAIMTKLTNQFASLKQQITAASTSSG